MRDIWKLIFWLSISSLNNVQAHELRLIYPDFPPFTYAKSGEPAAGNFLLDQIMKKLKQPYHSRQVPNYKRALNDIERNLADGFFFASQNQKRDQVAQFSKPLLVNNWSWFFRQENFLDPHSKDFKAKAKIASLEGTNTLTWLKNNHYKVVGKQNDVVKLAQLLFDLKRIDAAFLSAEVFKYKAIHSNMRNGQYIEVVQRSAPFGIYISKAYIEEHPQFMPRLNQAIDQVQKQYLPKTHTLSELKR
ncbi:substrate-binding periplasmic protein [Agarivorans sp. QJM3NY_29]|uniref:substrate-binding periplasmic protein n=1 Tax=unclassified Agarivorans TaxID=2636026 RepID=UPI003D7D31A9